MRVPIANRTGADRRTRWSKALRARLVAASVIVLGCLGLYPAAANATTTVLRATLTGAAVPGGGDPNGSGFAYAVVDDTAGQICVVVVTQGTGPVLAIHIHRGAAGVIGPHAVDLAPPANFPGHAVSAGCIQEPVNVLRDIVANPSGFYVNVHTDEFIAGAVRGQLTAV